MFEDIKNVAIAIHGEEVVEGNTLIAEFLGGIVKEVYRIKNMKTYAWYGDHAINYRRDILKINIGDSILQEHLFFHDNWLWLMPVIEKIESMGYSVYIKNNQCRIFGLDEDTARLFADVDKITATWKAIVNFIKNYNKKHENN